MLRPTTSKNALRGIALCWLMLGAFAGLARAQAPGDITTAFSQRADDVVLTLTEHPGELAVNDALTVQVFGDGRVEVHRPAYMKRAGDRSLKLSRDELQRLVARVARGVVEADHDIIAAEKQRRSKGRLWQVSDGARTTLEVSLQHYHRTGGPVLAPARRGITWRALAADARQFGDIPSLQGLAAARQALMALADRAR
jgi:hypothetical protein